MCGIVGIRRFDGAPVEASLLQAMLGQLQHRGPDGQGIACEGSTGFGHVRLAILDPNGSAQPMRSANGRAVITFNGEVFHHEQLRQSLLARGVTLRTRGDTEALLETLRLDGPGGLAAVNGQFAFGFHDPDTGALFVGRDRLGILPLYYAEGPDFFAFASEIKALLPALGAPSLDEHALEDYLIYRSVPPPRTLFRGIRKLAPGTVLHVRSDGRIREQRYWSLPAAPTLPMLRGDDAMAALEQQLERSVAARMVADVPVGTCLSGGLDSSLITALAQRRPGAGKVATFAAGFGDPRHDELPFARLVSDALGTDHHEVVVTPADFAQQWSKLSWHRDGPISEPGDIALFRLAQHARQHVKVLLSGEGSDELFGGYPKHRADALLRPLAWLPDFLRVPTFRALEQWLPARREKARIAARVLAARTPAERMQAWFAPFTWYERARLRRGFGSMRAPRHWDEARGDHLRRMLYVDCHGWLADNLLERGDRMAMAASVELRPPFLDHELVELAFRIDSRLKIRGGAGKWILRRIAARHLPQPILERPKVGFRAPLDAWFRGGLRDFARDHLLARTGFVATWFDRRMVEQLLDGHERGRHNDEARIWTLLGLEVFWRTCLRPARVPSRPTVLEPVGSAR